MPDITMCANDACPDARKCRRNEASGTKADGRYQSWSHFAPLDGVCEHFWPTHKTPGGEGHE